MFKDNSELIMPWTSQFLNHSEVTLSVEGSFIHWINVENNKIFSDNPLTLIINKNIHLKAVFDSDICFDFNLNEGFNPVSLPVFPSDNNVSSVLQSTDASAYRFSGNNYVPVNNLLTKIGYWVKLHESKKLTVCGPPLNNLNLELAPGFHFIGSVSTKQTPSTIPTDNIEAIYIWKDNAWVEVTEMTPGLAHCVKIKTPCQFILNGE
ncbi:MAG: hypothetical protein OMM_05274 [Candidatus Magnetoglobus multicellularis str. Araruama]|uniref:Uncharacterized protein n=1 Tax=Candidatus Magnetoglobus multicellularis str. Araruama TaxID=890399 RepID=A0A1V1NX67_9BACT|nr:MAG: hypothetical protein OMM_05274 [Candidatus Magnetoglobus multicellularis str. Araruama]